MSPRLSPPATDPVVVLGGAGYFGRLLVDDLLSTSDASLLVVGRSGRRLGALTAELGKRASRVSTATLDVRDRRQVEDILEPGRIVVDCAGPFQMTDGYQSNSGSRSCGVPFRRGHRQTPTSKGIAFRRIGRIMARLACTRLTGDARLAQHHDRPGQEETTRGP